MPIRLTGLISGLDTDTVIKELMSAQSMKKTKIEKKKTKEEWKKEKWEELNTKLYSLYTKQVSKMKLQGSYLTKKVTSSNEGVATATANSNAADGSHTLQVKQLASSQYVTSGKLEGTTSSTKLAEKGLAAEGSVITIKNGDTTKYLEVTASTTVKDLVTALKEAGLNASFDEGQKRFFISSKESGAENAFSITGVGSDSPLAVAKKALEADNAAGGVSAKVLNKFYNDYANALNVEEKDEEAIKALEEQLIAAAEAAKKAELEAEATEQVAKAYADGLTETDADYIAAKESLEERYATTTDDDGKTVYKAEIKKRAEAALKAKAEAEVAAEIENGTVTEEGKAAAIAAKYETYIADEAEMKAAVQNLYEEDLDAALVQKGKEYTASEAGMAEVAAIVEAKQSEIDAVGANVEAALVNYRVAVEDAGTNASDISEDSLAGLKLTKAAGASIVEAQDAKIVLDGAELTGSSNTFIAAGITLELKNTTEAGKDANGDPIYSTVSMNISNDVDEAYNNIKEFLKEYNSILEEMNTLYDAPSARGYEPLTDEEKEAMTDDQIELWENKIKDSLLRRDGTLSSITSAMRTAMQSVVEIDGKKYSLASFGIMTSSDYTENGLLHIYGDEDDSTYSDQDDKLKAALSTDPETTTRALSEIMNKLSDALFDKMKKTSLSSALTFYNDVQMKNTIKDYEDEIDKWEDKLKDIENRYYKQFAAMESAMASLQSQSSYLSNLMGGV